MAKFLQSYLDGELANSSFPFNGSIAVKNLSDAGPRKSAEVDFLAVSIHRWRGGKFALSRQEFVTSADF